MSAPTPPVAENPFVQWLTRYRNDPVLFVQEVLGAEPDPWQRQVLRWAAAGERQISVASGHSSGKSTCAAWLSIWYILCFTPLRIIITAPSSPQLFDVLYAELVTWIDKLPKALQERLNVRAESIELASAPSESFIAFRTARAETPESVAGRHAYGGKTVVIGDEASGLAVNVTDSIMGTMAQEGALFLLLGNPLRASGLFYDTHHKLKDSWKTLTVSSEDCPRIPKSWVEEMEVRYGRDSNAFRVRVLGQFPTGDDDTVIPMDLMMAAVSRETMVGPAVPTVWGVDVARFGSDCSALAKRKGRQLLEKVTTYKGLDLVQLCGQIHAEYDCLADKDKPSDIFVDSIGVGGGVVDILRDMGLPVRGINVSEAPSTTTTTYLNLRAELLYRFRGWLAGRDVSIPNDQRLIDEATSIRYKFAHNGKIQIESKEQMKSRGLDSPDVCDAVVLTFAADAVTLSGGSRGLHSWSTPLRRGTRLL